MWSRQVTLALLAVIMPASAAPQGANERIRREVVSLVEAQAASLVSLSDRIWEFAETALRETRSSALLASHAEEEGFRVTRGVAGMPTAFVAEYGQGPPIIAILGEYDALPGISQRAEPVQAPLVAGAPGHGCGHNLFGAGSLGAATAIKRLIQSGRLRGTIRYYGTPAEEAVGGKVYMVRDGLFRDVDVVLAWHPADRTRADTRSSQAIIDFLVEFRGRTAHAAFDPWNGRSAADGAEAFIHGVNLLREHVRPSVRMHYVIQQAGNVPNVIPDYAKVWMWVRDSKSAGAEAVLERVREIARGAALIAGVEASLKVQGGDYEILVNQTGARLLDRNLRWLGPIPFSEEEQAFARAIQRATGVPERGLDGSIQPMEPFGLEPEGGSTDVGDVSWVVPTLHFSATTAALDAPWHAWPVVATAGMSIGHKGMLHAAKTLAVTAADLFADARLREQIRAEFAEQTREFVYRPYIPDGPPPIPHP
jgi:aminobenzoyl-glutamate utilization protein B